MKCPELPSGEKRPFERLKTLCDAEGRFMRDKKKDC
jgi:hypothetical protein